MFEKATTTLADLRDAMERYTTAFDAARVPAIDAADIVAHATAIERMAATVKALAAHHVSESLLWRGAGERSAANHLARATGTSVTEATGLLDTARRLHHLHATANEARRGRLSRQQLAAIADAATADPSAEERLLEQARRTSLGELRDECARVKAAARPDAELRRREIHERRYLRTYTDAEGGWNLQMRDNPERGAEIMAAIGPIRDRLFHAARAAGRREPVEAYAADALVELARCRDSGSRSRGSGRERVRQSNDTKIVVRVDLDSLLRGYPISGETMELAGYGPVAASAIEDMLSCGDPFLAAVVTKGVDVATVAHLGRRPSRFQQTALEWLAPTCTVEGCSTRVRLENDHRIDWSKTKITLLDLLDRLCSHHHDLKTFKDWALVAGKGKRPFVPPDDPRHPGLSPPAVA
ncbi:MAG: protein of unknown function endonuclease [Acidimicrobiales bacterium]|nr:protein of unknown function endonuclease [Acidimicrobiales bacterium]